MQLGARGLQVVLLVLRESVLTVVAGTVLGVAVAFPSTRLIAGMQFGVESGDPVTVASAAGVLITVALLSALLSARRAATVDPLIALRE